MAENDEDKKTDGAGGEGADQAETRPSAATAAATKSEPAAQPRVVGGPVKADSKNRPAGKTARGGGMSAFQRFLLLVSFLLALAAAALAAWMYQQEYLLPAQPDPRFETLRGELREQQQVAEGIRRALDSQREAMAQLRRDYQAGADGLTRQQQKLAEELAALTTVDRADWLLAEAEYLMRLANQRAQLHRDAGAAAKLLGSADELLRDLDDPALHPARAALAEEIAALKGAADFDVEGAYLRIEGLIASAGALRLYEAPIYRREIDVESGEQDWRARLRSGLDKAWQKLRSYIRIRHHDANFRPVLEPEQEAALRISLRLMLEQAQLALLAERPALFQRSLEKARAALEQYYLLDDSRDAMVGEIDSLMGLPVARSIADISGSLRELKAYAKNRRWHREASR